MMILSQIKLTNKFTPLINVFSSLIKISPYLKDDSFYTSTLFLDSIVHII